MDLNFDVKNKWAVIAWINPWRSIFSFLRFDDWKLAITNAEAKTWGSHLQQMKLQGLFHAHRSSVSSEELLSIFMKILLDFYIWMINIYFEIKITAVKRVKRRRFHYLFYENLFIMYSILTRWRRNQIDHQVDSSLNRQAKYYGVNGILCLRPG